jgi:hypothetical protein
MDLSAFSELAGGLTADVGYVGLSLRYPTAG